MHEEQHFTKNVVKIAIPTYTILFTSNFHRILKRYAGGFFLSGGFLGKIIFLLNS
jgi:hypothetical protein